MFGRKKKKVSHYRVLEGDMKHATANSFEVVLRGKPESWRRVARGRNNNVYNPNGPLQREFYQTLRQQLPNGYSFAERQELQVTTVFAFNNDRVITSRGDVDNLAKFVLDAISGDGKIIPNDAQVVKLITEKIIDVGLGESGYTKVMVSKSVIEIM